MTLSEAKNSQAYIVVETNIQQPLKRRLEAMGLIEGTKVRKINEALDGSIIIMIRGTRLAIDKDIGDKIIIRDVTASDRGRGQGGPGRGVNRGRGGNKERHGYNIDKGGRLNGRDTKNKGKENKECQ